MRPVILLLASRTGLHRSSQCTTATFRQKGVSVVSWTQLSRPFATLRRSRKKFEKYATPQLGIHIPTSGGLDQPFEYSGQSIGEYSEKANLSPWVPVPDSVARKIFDRAVVTSEDVSYSALFCFFGEANFSLRSFFSRFM
jgi:hypothetical protein